jgi:hypothetical protein
MDQNSLLLLFFPIQLLFLYFISRQTIKELFFFFRKFMPERAVTVLVTILFLPGTIMHELAHFIMAISLMLHVHEVSILPEFEKNYIKLGKVVYGKKDILRGIIVGIAPIIAGLIIFWLFSIWNLFPSSNLGISILIGYVIFVVSTTMFSSKQDLVDLIYIIPIGIIIVAFLYIFNINVTHYISHSIWDKLSRFILHLNLYFLFSFVLHIGIIVLLKSIRKILK